VLTLAHIADDIALAASSIFTAVALLSILYTAGMYTWRVRMIRCAAVLLLRALFPSH